MELGLSINDLDQMEIGEVFDMLTERGIDFDELDESDSNDGPDQSFFDNFARG